MGGQGPGSDRSLRNKSFYQVMAFDIYEWSMRAYLRFVTSRRGELVGKDEAGNAYYVDRRTKGTRREKRWVFFNGGDSEASRVPAGWHGWLHHQTDTLPSADKPFHKPWVKEHVPNLTGSVQAYRPPGSSLRGEQRDKATGDYEPWVPK